MTSPGFPNVLHLYQQTLSLGVLEYLQKQGGWKPRRGIFSARVVLWLMILQRLHAVKTLAATVQLLQQGVADPLLQNCRRVREHHISCRTGGYCQARQKMPALLCRQVNREITEKLRNLVCPQNQDVTPRFYVIDGSSLELESTRDFIAALSRSTKPAWGQPLAGRADRGFA